MEQPDVQAIAERQAAKDAELLAALEERKKAAVSNAVAEVMDTEQEPMTITLDRVPMNRAQRRQQVRQYATLLALTERQEPFVHPTIVPRSKRRRRPGQKGRLQHA